jgi:superfamily I DNA/RNA helicase
VSAPFDDPDVPWREAERSWATWLVQQRYTVTDLGTATGNAPRTSAPMIATAGSSLRAPDLQTVKSGVTEFWEVKLRSASHTDPATGARQHWMSRASFVDYHRAADATQAQVWIVLYETPTALAPGRWLRASVRRLRDLGHRGERTGQNGEPVDAWIWPVTAMEVVEGPPVLLRAAPPVLPTEGPLPAIGDADLDLAERSRRSRRPAARADASAPPAGRAAASAIEQSAALSLAVVCRRLGLPAVPRYSLTRIGPLDDRAEDVLELLHHGIRLFLVTDTAVRTVMDPGQLAAFRAARLLEDAAVPDAAAEDCWIIDGNVPDNQRDQTSRVLEQVDAAGSVNLAQWQIVHAPADANVVVEAGAGTGKTETMSERLVFLLATADDVREQDGEVRPQQLTVDQIALVTFTREAAQQMRARLARTLLLRQRLCARCVPPVRAWTMQLANAQISTVHAFAKELIRQFGGVVGYGPGFRITPKTLEFRAALQDALSADLAALGAAHGKAVPPAHAWEDHLESVWAALDNNGTPAMSLSAGAPTSVDWGAPRGDGLAADIHRVTRETVARAAKDFARICRNDQAVPTSHLVPLAHAAVRAAPAVAAGSPAALRYLFVDEFQDTDALQIDLLLDVHELRGARLFVVGDVKQGIYRFRGAAGNAFRELAAKTRARGLRPFLRRTLTRNFRCGAALLDSLHPHFARWGEQKLLDYDDPSQLRPGKPGGPAGQPAELRPIPWKAALPSAARQVGLWRNGSATESVAILCRENWQAHETKRLIEDMHGTCDVLVGGDFFRTSAAREMRALLDAVAAPHDRAALLELCETRWAASLLTRNAPMPLREPDSARWDAAAGPVSGWPDRLAHAAVDGNLLREDLHCLQERLELLRGLLQTSSALGLIADAVNWFSPDETARAGDEERERRRYQRCLDHLVTLMDGAFADRPASLTAILEWLRLQIATNESEDAPVDLEFVAGSGTTLALTVHKAKGLEFDRVIVPVTTGEFVTSKARQGRTDARVVPGAARDHPPALLWEWTPPKPPGANDAPAQFANYAEDSGTARTDLLETVREETRLLYVAMTRAKKELVVLVPAARAPAVPNRWVHLLFDGRTH